jgi:uncharacterized membrane protein YdfJ with MMPL/SSD domain
MEETPLEERLGTDHIEDTSTASVQAIFRHRSRRMQKLWPIRGHVTTRRPLQIVLIAATVLILLATIYAIGVGF